MFLRKIVSLADNIYIILCSWRLMLTRRVPLMEQELLALPDHLGSPPVFSGSGAAQSLVFFVDY